MTVPQKIRHILQNPLFWLLAVSAFTLLYYFGAHEGFYFGDDYSYSLYAHQLLHGGFHFDDYSFCHRFMVFVPTALFYWLWGMNVYTTTLWPLLCTLGTLFLLYNTFKQEHPIATSWALIFLGLYFFQLNTVNFLYPDNILLFFTSVCLLLLYKVRIPLPTFKQQVLWGAVFALFNLFAFLTKETIVYAVPFYLCLFTYHVLRRENLRFWATAALTGVVLLAIYFLLYKIFSGDALQRFYDIKATNTAETKQAYLDSRSATLLPRLTYQPILFFIGSGLAIPLAFSVLAFSRSVRGSKLFSLQNPLNFWLFAMLGMLFPIWFGTATVDFYKPMPLLPRMFHPLLPTFCLTAGLALEKVFKNRGFVLWLTIFFGFCAFLSRDDMWVMYLPLAIFFLSLLILNRSFPHWLALAVVAIVSAIRPVYFIVKPTVSYYFEQKEIVDQHLSSTTGKYVVLTDSTMLRRYPFFYGFEVPQNYSFTSYAAADSALAQATDTVFLLINNGVLEHPELMIRLREKDILPKFPSARQLQEKGKVKLYYLPKEQ